MIFDNKWGTYIWSACSGSWLVIGLTGGGEACFVVSACCALMAWHWYDMFVKDKGGCTTEEEDE